MAHFIIFCFQLDEKNLFQYYFCFIIVFYVRNTINQTSTVPGQELRSSCVNSWMGTALGKDGNCPRNCNHLRDGDGPRYGYSPMDSDSL